MFEPMDLKTIASTDLAALLEAMRELALTKNRVALDLFAIIETEMLSRHQPVEIGDYLDTEIAEATVAIAAAIDATRARGITDDYPAVQFLRFNITTLVNEMEKRGMVKEVQ
jgi:hypothetical protein